MQYVCCRRQRYVIMSGCARKELQNVELYPYALSSCIALHSEFTEISGAVGICLSHGNLAGKAVSLDYVDAFERAVGFGHVASCKVIDAKVSRAVHAPFFGSRGCAMTSVRDIVHFGHRIKHRTHEASAVSSIGGMTGEESGVDFNNIGVSDVYEI